LTRCADVVNYLGSLAPDASRRDAEPDQPPPAPGGPGSARWTPRSWRFWATAVACVALLAVAARAGGPMIAESVHSFAHLRWRPVVFAVLAETGSMVALALMERRLLILAVVVSNAVFVVIISIGAIVSGNPAAIAAGAAGIAASALIVAVAVVAGRRPAVGARVTRAAVWTLSRVQRLIRRPAGDAAAIVAGTMEGLASFHPNRGDVFNAVASAFRNWALDLLCLAFSIRAAGVDVPWWGIVLAWAAGAGGASLSPTPGGLGVVEAALTGALVAVFLLLRREHEPAGAA